MKENPRRAVIHFESPPRRRLREHEDLIVRGYMESCSNKQKEEESSSPNPKGTMDRFVSNKKEHEKRMAYLRRKKAMEEMASLKDKPDITRYKFTKPRIPVTERKVEEQDFDDRM